MKTMKFLILTVLVLSMMLALAGCGLADRVMGLFGTADAEGDASVRAVYDSYAAYMSAAGEEPLDYATWLESIKGERGESVSVMGCSLVATTSAGMTYRLSFSDGSYADFTVPPVGGDRAADLETLLSLVEVERTPSRTEGQSTVGNGATTSKDITSTFVGWAFYMTKTAMFGDADEVIGIYLNSFNIEAVEGVEEAEITVEFLSIDGKESFLKADTMVSYSTTIEPKGVADYYLDLYISKDDLADLGEEFMIGLVMRDSPRVRMQASQNSTYKLASTDKMKATLPNGTMAYSGYYTKADTAGARVNIACSHSANTPDIFFSTAIEETVTINGIAAGGASGGTADEASSELLRLPEYYELVVGDNFELFYKGLVLCVDSDAYDFELSFASGKNLGKGYARKYTWTPTSADIGTHVLNIKVRNNEGRVLDEGSVELRVAAVPKSPAKEKTVLVIGDSLTSGGLWVSEMYRRLTGTGGTPAADGLTNIKLIGSKGTNGAYHEGYGGWTYASFTTANKRNDQMILTGNFSDKNDAEDQHSSYVDSNGQVWKIEYVTATEMKIICNSATGKLPSTTGGTLTHQSGGANTKDIVYTSARQADANPFWDAAKGKNNFKAYVEKHGATSLDEVIIFLGWNQTTQTLEAFRESAVKLIDSILEEYPNCHITLVTQQLPSRDGFANNYGVSWPWFEKVDKIFDFQDIYIELANSAKYRGNLSVVSIAGQFDTAYNEIKTTITANNRNNTTVTIGSNGVHPSNNGYLQIADALYRHMIHRLSSQS